MSRTYRPGEMLTEEEYKSKMIDEEADMEIRSKGNPLYKTGGIEPIDLYKSGGMLRDFVLSSIIKYAFRNRRALNEKINEKDINKIIHYAQILLEMEK